MHARSKVDAPPEHPGLEHSPAATRGTKMALILSSRSASTQSPDPQLIRAPIGDPSGPEATSIKAAGGCWGLEGFL